MTPWGNLGVGDFSFTTSGLSQQPTARLHVYNDNRPNQTMPSVPSGNQFGVLAQQLEEHFPQYVRDAHNPPVLDSLGNTIYEGTDFKAVSYDFLVPLLVQGVKEQQTHIESLNSRIDEMEVMLAEIGLEKGLDVDKSNAIRSDYELYQNRPNPFQESTEIVWRMAEEAQVRILVQDVQGSTLAVLSNGSSSRGMHSVFWNAEGLPAGTYFYSLEVNGQLMVKRAIKLER